MKKLIRILLVLVSTPLFAQQGFQVGGEFGLQFIELMNKSDKSSPDLSYTYQLHPVGGLVAGYNFNNYMGLEVEVLDSRQGQTYSGTATNDPNAYSSIVALQTKLANETLTDPYQAKSELNCIKIPVLFKLMTDNSQKLFFTAMIGPQANFIFNVAQEVNRVDHSFPGLGVEPIDLYKSFTIDGVLALGVGVNLSTHLLFTAQARFDYGFEDVENKDMTYTYNGTTNLFFSSERAATHNATAALMVGISYKLFSSN